MIRKMRQGQRVPLLYSWQYYSGSADVCRPRRRPWLVMMVKNELQNAADAGALAGAGIFILTTVQRESRVPTRRPTIRLLQTRARKTRSILTDPTGKMFRGDIGVLPPGPLRRTHPWTPVDLSNATTAELDANTNFINAVRVRVRTQTPVASFFSRIWGGSPFFSRAEAVGYIGFAGSLRPHDVDQPIAICKQSILNNAVSTTVRWDACSTAGVTRPLTILPGGPTSVSPVIRQTPAR